MATVTQVSDYVVAAICGNFWQESGVNPAVWQSLATGKTWTDLNVGYGLGQWTNTGGDTHGRLYQLHEYLSTNGFSDDDGDGELEFLLEENHWAYHSEYPFNNLQEFLDSKSTNLTMLTHAWNLCWEGIHDSSWDVRVTYANNVYNYLQSHGKDSNTWIKGNRYLSNDERYNNCVLIFQYLGGYHGKKGMPLYMMLRRPMF